MPIIGGFGEERKEGNPHLCNIRDLSGKAGLGAPLNCSIHINGCILASRILTVAITQPRESASSSKMPLLLKNITSSDEI